MIIRGIYPQRMISANKIVQRDSFTVIHEIWVSRWMNTAQFSFAINSIHIFGITADPRNSIAAERRPGNIPLPHRPMNLGLDMNAPRKLPQPMLETKTDYGKYR